MPPDKEIAADTVTPTPVVAAAVAPEVTPEAPASDAGQSGDTAPKTMEEAIAAAVGPKEGDEESGANAKDIVAPKQDAAHSSGDAGDANDDDKLIAGLSKRAQSRFRKLVEEKKALDGSVKELSGYRDQMTAMAELFQSTGLSPEKLAEVIELNGQLQSEDATLRGKAFARMEAMRADMAKRFGIAVPGVDVLADFPELAKQVEELEITRAAAEEIARARKAGEVRDMDAQERAAQANAERAQRMEVAAAVEDMNALGKSLAASDPAFEAKMKIMHAKVLPRLRGLPPAQWKTGFMAAWDGLGEVRSTSQPSPPVVRGLAGGSAEPEPRNMLDAVNQALRGLS